VPGKIIRPIKAEELEYMQWLTGHYLELAEQYLAGKFKSVGPTKRRTRTKPPAR